MHKLESFFYLGESSSFFRKPTSKPVSAAALSPDKQHNSMHLLPIIVYISIAMMYPEHWPQFYTATFYKWQHLLAEDKHKDIIIDSLKFLVKEKRIELNALVIMSNHIHLVWQPQSGFSPTGIQSSFMKYTAQQLKRSLTKNNPELLQSFKVDNYDREYKIWKRAPLSIELITSAVFEQKLNYIHNNPVRAGLCTNPEEYHYSSARFYVDGTDSFGMLTHYLGNSWLMLVRRQGSGVSIICNFKEKNPRQMVRPFFMPIL